MAKIGIYGGSFNPIHNGHLNLAKTIANSGIVDEVWLLVSPINPLKERKDMLDDYDRLELAKIACEGINGVWVSDFEMGLPQPSYTYKTLQKLDAAFPQHEFFLIIGADNWLEFDKWKEHKYILGTHRIIVFPRDGYELDWQTMPENVLYLDRASTTCISSTQIREGIRRGDYNGEGLPSKVWEEIKEKKYYH